MTKNYGAPKDVQPAEGPFFYKFICVGNSPTLLPLFAFFVFFSDLKDI